MRVVLGVLLILLTGAGTVGDAAAYYCSAPIAPSCATRYGAFDDEDDFDRCKRMMTTYKIDTEEYLRCLKRESDNALEEYSRTVDSFNRRARG